MNNENLQLIIKYLKGELSIEDTNKFYEWVNLKGENKQLYFEVKTIYDGCIQKNRNIDIEKSWEKLLHKKRIRRFRLFREHAAITAAVTAACFTLIVTLSLFTFNTPFEEKKITQFVGKDGIDSDMLILPDGTEINLGTQTNFYYDTDFGKKSRTVYLDGEAYFHVTKQSGKPFIVKVKDQDIEVIGTKFNVNAYSWDSITTTTLLEGSIRLISENISQPVVLKPNQQYIYNRNTQTVAIRNVDASQYTRWISGYYHFSQQSLENILYRLGQVYGIKFTIYSHTLEKKMFTGTFYRGQSIRDILEIINISIPIQYEIRESEVRIFE